MGATLQEDGCLEKTRACLHLLASEMAAKWPNRPEKVFEINPAEIFGWEKWAARLADRLQGGELRALCLCSECNAVRTRRAHGFWEKGCECVECNPPRDLGALVGLLDVLTPPKQTYCDQMHISLLRSMRDSKKLKASDGTMRRVDEELALRAIENYNATYWAGPIPGGLGDRATPRAYGWAWHIDENGNDVWEEIDGTVRANRDEKARAYWADFVKGGRK